MGNINKDNNSKMQARIGREVELVEMHLSLVRMTMMRRVQWEPMANPSRCLLEGSRKEERKTITARFSQAALT